MSDEIRMTLLHHSTNDLIEQLLMWRGLAAEHFARIAELEYQLEDWAEDYKARIAELEEEVTKGNELQDSYCDRIAKLEAYVAELEAEKRGEK